MRPGKGLSLILTESPSRSASRRASYLDVKYKILSVLHGVSTCWDRRRWSRSRAVASSPQTATWQGSSAICYEAARPQKCLLRAPTLYFSSAIRRADDLGLNRQRLLLWPYCVVSLAFLIRFRPENHFQLAFLNFKAVSFSILGSSKRNSAPGP
jgi:hypothetical protein